MAKSKQDKAREEAIANLVANNPCMIPCLSDRFEKLYVGDAIINQFRLLRECGTEK